MKKDVMVTVIITAYNHEKYIEQAIQGILDQKTEYEYELVIHDDASTDGTQDIIRAYEKRYPDKVKSIIEKENLFSQGKLGAVFYDSRLAGKYLAICDGDDYWTCDTKLQKQISYLEQHPECSMPLVFRIRGLMFSVKEIFRSLKNMIQRSLSMCVVIPQKNIWRW